MDGVRELTAGYDSGIISSIISENYTQFHAYFNPDDDPRWSSIVGAIVSVFAGGAFCESPVA